MAWQLRATAGPLKGAVYRIRKRVSLGRAGDCDIQIISDGVSRRHAKVVHNPDAPGFVLVDLESNNGTFVGEERIGRHVLVPGDEVRIMRSCFVYEVAPDAAGESTHSAEVWAVKVTDGRTLRRTADLQSLPAKAPLRGDTQEDMEVDTAQADAKGGRVGTQAKGAQRQRVEAVHPSGRPYRGDLLGDIQRFRDLQLRAMRHDTLSPSEHTELQGYVEAFRQSPGDPSPYAALRRFVRFRCQIPARVRWLDDAVEQSTTVVVKDIGVGGARLTWRQHPLGDAAGVVLWLVVDVVSGQQSRTLVFPTRVAWAEPNELGVEFVGMP